MNIRTQARGDLSRVSKCDPPLSLRHAVDLPCDLRGAEPPGCRNRLPRPTALIRSGKSRQFATLGMRNFPGPNFLTCVNGTRRPTWSLMRGKIRKANP